jgi:hypothetical protein
LGFGSYLGFGSWDLFLDVVLRFAGVLSFVLGQTSFRQGIRPASNGVDLTIW